MASTKKGFGIVLLTLAMAIFLIVSGILTLQLDSGFMGKLQASVTGNEVAVAVHSFMKGDAATAVIIALGICELIAGVFLALKLFLVLPGKMLSATGLIVIIVWAAILILVDIVGDNGLLGGKVFKNAANCLDWFKSFSVHLTVLGALITVHSGN